MHSPLTLERRKPLIGMFGLGAAALFLLVMCLSGNAWGASHPSGVTAARAGGRARRCHRRRDSAGGPGMANLRC